VTSSQLETDPEAYSGSGGDGLRPRSGRKPTKRQRRIAWSTLGIFVVLAGLAVYAATQQGVKTVDFSHGTVSFYQVRSSQIQRNQPALRVAVRQARSSAQAQATPSPSASDFSGTWRSSSGLTYTVAQYGDQAVVEEHSPFGLTAVGRGTVAGNTTTFDYRAVDGSTGRASFQMVDRSTIEASFESDSYGTSTRATLTR
jgi:hypothetical protein